MPSPASRSLNACPYTPLGCVVIPPARHVVRLSPLTGPESRRCFLCRVRHCPGSALACRPMIEAKYWQSFPKGSRSIWPVPRCYIAASTPRRTINRGRLAANHRVRARAMVLHPPTPGRENPQWLFFFLSVPVSAHLLRKPYYIGWESC